MLIQKKFEPTVGTVVLVKLINGDEVIGRVSATEGSTLKVSRPLRLLLRMTPTGEAQVTFAPFIVGADEADDVVLDTAKFLVPAMRPNKELEGVYRAQTSSIIPAGAPALNL
jgi:hypothetical protein